MVWPCVCALMLALAGTDRAAGISCPVLPARTFYCTFVFEDVSVTPDTGCGVTVLGTTRVRSLEAQSLQSAVGRLAGMPAESLRVVSGNLVGTTRQSPLQFRTKYGDGIALAVGGGGRRVSFVLCAVQNDCVRSATSPRLLASSEVLVARARLADRERLVAIVLPRGQEKAERDRGLQARITQAFGKTLRGLRQGPPLALTTSQASDTCGACGAIGTRR